MIQLTEPQVWTLIGVFTTAIFGALALQSTLLVMVIKAEIRTVTAKIDLLDRDVQAIARRVFGEPDA